MAALLVTLVGGIGIPIDVAPGAVSFMTIGGVEVARVGVADLVAVGALRLDEITAEREHHRGLEDAGVTREAAAEVGFLFDESVPGNSPVRSRGDAARVPQSEISGGELGKLVIAAVAVDHKDPLEPVSNQRK